MASSLPTHIRGEKMRKAITCFSELLEQQPEISRKKLLNKVGLQFDLSPLECEFLDKHFSKENP